MNCAADGAREPRAGARLALAALVLYAGVSLVLFGWPVLGRMSRAYVGSGIDPTLAMWAFVWWPYALGHGLNPFHTDLLWAPHGSSLAWLTGVPGPSLLAAPLTQAGGPVVTYNVLALLAPALAAWAAYLVCRTVSAQFWPAVAGGYVFGFSSYEIGHTFGHLNLMLTCLVPLALYLVLLRLREAVWPSAFVLLLAGVLWLQFLCSNEIFATMTVFGAIAGAWAYALLPALRRNLRRTALLAAAAYALAAAGLAPYLFAILSGGVPRNPLTEPATYSADLLNIVVPTRLAFVGGAAFAPLSRTFGGNPAEQTAYLGLPLVTVIVLFGRAQWRRPEARLALAALGTVVLASLGPVLHIAGRPLTPLPWAVVRVLPVLNNALPGRFTLYAALVASIVLALWLASAPIPTPRGSAAPKTPMGDRTARERGIRVPLAVLAVACLLPDVWGPGRVTPVVVPPFIAEGLYRRYVEPGEAVLILPYGANGDCMLWQAASGMYFRMAEGVGTGSIPRDFFRWPVNYTFYSGRLIPDAAAQLRAYLAAHGVRKILVADAAPGPWPQLFGTLGVPVRAGGVAVYRVPERVLAASRGLAPLDIERRSTLALAASLIAAGNYYLAHEIPLGGLTPLDAEQRGLLPSYWGGYPATDANVRLGLAFSTHTGLRLGPWGPGAVAVGLRTSAEMAAPLLARYAPVASRVYFPYPRPVAGLPSPGGLEGPPSVGALAGGAGIQERRGEGVLLMVFTPDGLRRAAGLPALGVLGGGPD